MKKLSVLLLGATLFALAACGEQQSLERTPYENLWPLEGELQKRLEINYDRLQAPLFSFDSTTTAFTVREAPGDWIGREMLSQSILSRVLHRDLSPLMKEMVERVPEILNAEGYVGPILPDSLANEGQITGHNGFLRGLGEYYLWRKDEAVLGYIRTIIDNLFLRRAYLVAEYPSSVLKAQKEGGQVGHTVAAAAASRWQGLSTDIGQFFLTLDALSQIYTIAPSPELKAMIEAMIDKFAEINFAEIGGQTHSFLGCLRGVLNWYLLTGDQRYLELVTSRFEQYQDLAMTENYENFNWFDRPLWTEGCAVVDAFMLAAELWRVTGSDDDLHLAHLMLYNGIYANQRPHGGFGCNNCVGARGQLTLRPDARIYEAPWCCSMRGSEALVEALSASFCTDAERIVVPFYQNVRACLTFPDGNLELAMTTDYPYTGRVRIEVLSATTRKSKSLQLFLPEWADEATVCCTINGEQERVEPDDDFVTLNRRLRAGDVIELTFDLLLYEESAHLEANAGYRRLFHGPLLLGTSSAEGDATVGSLSELQPIAPGTYRDKTSGSVLFTLPELTWLPEADSRTFSVQVLFPDAPM